MSKLSVEQKFFLSEWIRVLFTLCVFYICLFPLFYKILLLVISDSFDCGFSKLIFGDWIDPNTEMYQISDKITDTVCYTFLLIFLWQSHYLSEKSNIFLTILYLFRFIGTMLYIVLQNRQYLLYFPNFFLESSLIFTGMKQFSIPNIYLPFLFVLMIFWKFIQEYYLHVYKENHPNAIL